MFVHISTCCYMPEFPVNSKDFPLGYLLLAGFLCGGKANSFLVAPSFLGYAQHHTGTGTAVFCLGHRAYGQDEKPLRPVGHP